MRPHRARLGDFTLSDSCTVKATSHSSKRLLCRSTYRVHAIMDCANAAGIVDLQTAKVPVSTDVISMINKSLQTSLCLRYIVKNKNQI
jgi:hypothetical protein